jgi:hypothetical protein
MVVSGLVANDRLRLRCAEFCEESHSSIEGKWGKMFESIQNAYAIVDQFQLSITGLLIAIVVLGLIFIFAVREAATWFFKVDDVKRELRSLQFSIVSLEAEMKALQNVLRNEVLQNSSNNENEQSSAQAQEKKPASFPLVH